MARASVNRVVQVGVESTKGTAVAADKQLPTMDLQLTRNIDVQQFRAQGFKLQTAAPIVHDFGGGSLAGPMNFTEIVYLLSTIVTPVISHPGTLAYQWLFTALASGANAFKTLTIQEGDSTAALQMAYALLTEFGISYNDSGATISGNIVGRTPTTGTLSSSPSIISQLPGTARGVDIYMDAIGGTIGTTKVASAKEASFSVSNIQSPNWVLNTTYQSFVDTVETALSLSASFTMEFDSQARTLYDAVVAASNPVKLIRFLITGPLIESSTYYTLKIDFAAQVIGTEKKDADGVWAYGFNLLPQYNSTYGNKAFEITLITTLTTL
jgi:hypothetical protein